MRKKNWEPNKTLIDLIDKACASTLNESQYEKNRLVKN